MMYRLLPALRANLIWLVVCTAAVVLSTFFSDSTINSVTANVMFAIGALFGAGSLWKSAFLGRSEYDSVKWFLYAVSVGLIVLGFEGIARAAVLMTNNGDWYVKYLSAPINIIKLGSLISLLVVNTIIQNRGHDKRLARTIAIGVGLSTVMYVGLFFTVRAIVP